jgi:uncharacterized protein
MSVPGHTKESFTTALHEKLSPSSPIQSIEHLYGREAQLRDIDKALSSKGRHVFVHGDRGVGKTSLAQTAAFAHQTADNEPLLVSCNRSTTFFQIVETVCARIIDSTPGEKRTSTKTRKLSAFGLDLGGEQKIEQTGSLSVTSFNQAIETLRLLAPKHSQKALVVVDEFDLLPEAEKEQFADFIKQVGDRGIRTQFIFCGIGQSLDELLGAHASAYRYVEGIQVPRLRFDARQAIIDDSSEALGVHISDAHRFRIAAISDGFPHYVHLLCEKLYWEMFYDTRDVTEATREHYLAAIRAATKGIQQQLRKSYDKATMKDTDDNHLLLWAAADHPNLVRRKGEIYESYVKIARALNEQPMDEQTFYRQLATLKAPACGRILRGQSKTSRNWYQFTESIVRGYVRLRAEENGVALATEYTETTEPEITARPRRLKPVRGWRHELYSS